MTAGEELPQQTGSSVNAGPGNLATAVPDWKWLVRWVLLTTAAIPAAFILTAPIAAIGLPVQNMLTKTGLLNSDTNGYLMLFSLLTALALLIAIVQWYLLRSYLTRPGNWFLATAAGLWFSGLIFGLVLMAVSSASVPSAGMRALAILGVGAGLGVAQWLVLRREAPRPYWIIAFDTLAVGSILISGNSITSLWELLLILLLPGTLTGVGLWLVLSKPVSGAPVLEPARVRPSRQGSKIVRAGIILIALVPLFLGCSWGYARSQLALAKAGGIYATPEEAIIANNSQGWGGASVVKLENVRAEPNNPNGKQPHIWFGHAEVYLDRVPEGFNRSQYSSGTFYVHVQDGWVYMPEGAFPEFVGWAMNVFNLEGTRDWIATR